MISRRSLLRLLGSAAIIPPLELHSSTFLGSQEPSAVRKNIYDSLDVVRPTDPSFDGLLRTYFPGIQDAAAASLLPLSAIIRNNSGYAIRAASFRWNLTRPEGTHTFIRRAIYRPSLRPRFYRQSASKSILAASEIGLIHPLFFIGTNRYMLRLRKGQRVPQILKSQHHWKKHLESLQADVTASTVTTHSIFTTHGLYGPGSHALGTRLILERNAEHDLALSVLQEYVKSGKSETALAYLLMNEVGSWASVKGHGHKHVYSRARAFYARRFRSFMQKSSLYDIETVLRDVSSRERLRFQQS